MENRCLNYKDCCFYNTYNCDEDCTMYITQEMLDKIIEDKQKLYTQNREE